MDNVKSSLAYVITRDARHDFFRGHTHLWGARKINDVSWPAHRYVCQNPRPPRKYILESIGNRALRIESEVTFRMSGTKHDNGAHDTLGGCKVGCHVDVRYVSLEANEKLTKTSLDMVSRGGVCVCK